MQKPGSHAGLFLIGSLASTGQSDVGFALALIEPKLDKLAESFSLGGNFRLGAAPILERG
jgi:hypothetical protein